MSSLRCISLGCAKNLTDSERFAGIAASCGYSAVGDDDDADVCFINTCSFIRDAVEENISVILDAAEAKSQGRISRLIVAGCLVSRYGAKTLAEEVPEVDCWLMPEDYRGLSSALAPDAPACGPSRVSLPGGAKHVRYLKISEGCSNSCSYCMIPMIRGGHRSVAVRDVVVEAESLVADGARELCLVGQDLTAYGSDLVGRDDLLTLLSALESSLPHDVWLRLLYLQPMGLSRRLLEHVASSRQILRYLDIPIQHASEGVLASMGRAVKTDALERLFTEAREIDPDFALRTTCMVGYPGETRKDFDELMRFIERVGFDRLGAFVYSPEEGSPAAVMPHQVDPRTKRRRFDRLMTAQEAISASRQRSFIGRELDAVVDAVTADGVVECRSYREAPEVDGVIELADAPQGLAPGSRLTVRIVDASEHDMEAVPLR